MYTCSGGPNLYTCSVYFAPEHLPVCQAYPKLLVDHDMLCVFFSRAPPGASSLPRIFGWSWTCGFQNLNVYIKWWSLLHTTVLCQLIITSYRWIRHHQSPPLTTSSLSPWLRQPTWQFRCRSSGRCLPWSSRRPPPLTPTLTQDPNLSAPPKIGLSSALKKKRSTKL